REELLPPERFRDVVVGAGGQPAHLLQLLRTGREHDHRDVGEVADPLERLVAVHVGHRHVEDHERRRIREEEAEPGPAALSGGDAAVSEPCVGDGLRLARTLRARNVPLLFTSIYPPTFEALELEPAAYLVKPFPLSAIQRALEAVLTDKALSAAGGRSD